MAVSENQLRATMTRREAILGRGLFVLISDIGLPDGSGLDVMRHVKGRRQLKGIAISGFGMEDDLRRSREAGFEQHLTKPVNFQKLEAVIEQVAS